MFQNMRVLKCVIIAMLWAPVLTTIYQHHACKPTSDSRLNPHTPTCCDKYSKRVVSWKSFDSKAISRIFVEEQNILSSHPMLKELDNKEGIFIGHDKAWLDYHFTICMSHHENRIFELTPNKTCLQLLKLLLQPNKSLWTNCFVTMAAVV